MISALPSSITHCKNSRMCSSKATTRTTRSRKTAASLASFWLVVVITHTCLPAVVVNGEPIGANCLDSQDCDTGRCFYDKKGSMASGTCECNADTNAGCEDQGLTCSDEPLTSDGGKPTCLRPFGNICITFDECASYSCSNAQCDCSLATNDGCAEDQKCVMLGTGVRTCQNTTDYDFLELGSPCVDDEQCAASRCYLVTGDKPSEESPGTCVCNSQVRTDKGGAAHGCTLGLECSEIPTFADGEGGDFPTCRLPGGSTCTENDECVSGVCFNQEECAVCNIDLNYGCEEGQTCTASTSKDGTAGPPLCQVDVIDPENVVCDPPCENGFVCRPAVVGIATATCYPPRGSPCERNRDCASDFCDAVVSMQCQCNPKTNSGCAEGGECLQFSDGIPFCDTDTVSPTMAPSNTDSPSVATGTPTMTLSTTMAPSAKDAPLPTIKTGRTASPTTEDESVDDVPSSSPSFSPSSSPSFSPSSFPSVEPTTSAAVGGYGNKTMTTLVWIVVMTTVTQLVW